MEDATADRVISGDNSFAQVNPDPMYPTSFGDNSTEPLALPCCRDGVLVGKSAAGPKPCISPVEMRTPIINNSRRWLTSRRHNLYSDENHLSPIAFFVKRRRDQETYQPDKQPACLLLLVKGYSNKIKVNSGVRFWRFYGSSTRLSVSGRVARVALWGGFRLGTGWYPRLECFWYTEDLNIIFLERPYVLRLIAVPPKPC